MFLNVRDILEIMCLWLEVDFLETRRNKGLGKSLENCKLHLAFTVINIPWDMAAELLRLTERLVIVWHLVA